MEVWQANRDSRSCSRMRSGARWRGGPGGARPRRAWPSGRASCCCAPRARAIPRSPPSWGSPGSPSGSGATGSSPPGSRGSATSRGPACSARSPTRRSRRWWCGPWRRRPRGPRTSRAGDLKKVRSLQKLVLRSRSNALVSVRRVTEVNAGRRTAGVDGRIVLAGWEKADLAAWLQHGTAAWRPRPVRRVYVPKSNGRRRGLGIPVIADRALQALAVNALEPEWEARFEPRSYGFRPGRGCHDAIVAIHTSASRQDARRLWVLEAAFDRLSHDHILRSLGTFPARGLVRQWLRARVMQDRKVTLTTHGIPQGGVISPVVMNGARNGMQRAAGGRYWAGGATLT